MKNLNVAENEKITRDVQARCFDHIDREAYPDAKDVLFKLKQKGLKIGLTSTAYEEEITAILRKANLQTEPFHVIVGADTIKKPKPHPDFFRYTIKAQG